MMMISLLTNERFQTHTADDAAYTSLYVYVCHIAYGIVTATHRDGLLRAHAPRCCGAAVQRGAAAAACRRRARAHASTDRSQSVGLVL